MDINFRGGPYDGLRLSDDEVRRYTCPLRVPTTHGVRLFALLPNPADWEAVLAGEFGPMESRLFPYELVRSPGRGCGAEFQDATENGAFARAMAEEWAE